MHVILAKLYEEGGRPLARHRALTLAPSHEGVLSLHESHAPRLRRAVRKARIANLAGTEITLELYDAVVLFIGEGVMTITGMEIDAATRKATAQSWYVEILSEKKGNKAFAGKQADE
ncbi:MAG: hypothetical protein V4723_07420 [Pseudomonadota bacterium]